MIRIRHLVAGLVVAAGFSSAAQAQGYGPYWYGGWTQPLYNFSNREHLPYYSLFPPVYYSAPVPRTYGYSPFAYPPGMTTPDLNPAEPVIIENPHVKPQTRASKPAPDQQTRRVPKMIVNQYFVAAPRPEAEQLSGK